MKKILTLILLIFVVACTNESTTKNVDNLESINVSNLQGLSERFDSLHYKIVSGNSDDEVIFQYFGEVEIDEQTLTKLFFDFSGQGTEVYLNDNGEAEIIIMRDTKYVASEDPEAFNFTLLEVNARLTMFYNYYTPTNLKNTRSINIEEGSLLREEDIKINGYSGSREVFEYQEESQITGEVTDVVSHIGIFDEFMIIIYEERSADSYYNEYQLISFDLK